MRPPNSSTIRRQSVSPRPVPSSWAAPRPPCWKDSKIFSRSSGAIPIPVSDTATTSSPASRRAWTATVPPAGVNLTALPTRLTTTCLKRSSSDSTSPTSSATSSSSPIPWRAARSRTSERAYSSAPGTEKTVGSSRICPASIFDRSRISLSSSSRCRPELRMSPRYSSCRSFSSPNMPPSSTSEKPMTALSGVRSSWDMLARNSDLWRPATSRSRRLMASSRCTRALTIASVDWLARDWSRVPTSSANGPASGAARPGRRRAGPGAASGRPGPSASRRGRAPRGAGPAATSARSVTDTERCSAAARPTSEESRRMVTLRSRSSSAALLPCAARTWKVSVEASYSMIEPPSVPVRRTALATTRWSTSSRSEARADGVADLGQRLQLVDLGGELATPAGQGPRELDLPQDDGGRWRTTRAARPPGRRRGRPWRATA